MDTQLKHFFTWKDAGCCGYGEGKSCGGSGSVRRYIAGRMNALARQLPGRRSQKHSSSIGAPGKSDQTKNPKPKLQPADARELWPGQAINWELGAPLIGKVAMWLAGGAAVLTASRQGGQGETATGKPFRSCITHGSSRLREKRTPSSSIQPARWQNAITLPHPGPIVSQPGHARNLTQRKVLGSRA